MYEPKNADLYDDTYELFWAEVGAALSEVRKAYIQEIEATREPKEASEYLTKNEEDIKDAFYMAAWDAIVTMAIKDKMPEDMPFYSLDFEDVEETELLPDDTTKVHHF